MYHKSNLGKFQDFVESFSDKDGYVPQEEDDWRDMNYDLGQDQPKPSDTEEEREEKAHYLDEQWWPIFKSEAMLATKNAREAISKWQEQQ